MLSCDDKTSLEAIQVLHNTRRNAVVGVVSKFQKKSMSKVYESTLFTLQGG